MSDVRAIDAVVNIWTPEALACRPGWGPGFFVGKMKVDEALMQGLSLEKLIERRKPNAIKARRAGARRLGTRAGTRSSEVLD